MKNLKEISTRLEIAKKNIKDVKNDSKSANSASFGKALKISTELVADCGCGNNNRVSFGQLV